VRLRKLLLASLLGLGAITAVLPALASSETTPTVEAVSRGAGGPYGYETFAWSPGQVTIAANGTVAFANNSSTVEHGIIWTSSVKPACSSGVPVGEGNFATHWSGTCTFAQPGTYNFECSVHKSAMTGTITVSAAGTTTTTMTTTSSPVATTPAPATSTPATPPPPSQHATLSRAQKLARALKACRRQPKHKRTACVRRAHRRYGRSH